MCGWRYDEPRKLRLTNRKPVSQLVLNLLGNPVITLDNVAITRFRSEKARALLIYLSLEKGQEYTRDSLCALFWGHYSNKDARHNLSQAIFYLQRALGKDIVTRLLDASREAIQFRADTNTYVDAHEFLRLLAECENHPHRRIETCSTCSTRLERACALYRGELLAQFFLDDCPAFEEWLVVQREYFQRLAITALSQITAYYEEQGTAGYNTALRYVRRQVQLEAWREEPYRVLMRILAATGNTDAALAEYHTLANVLNQELGLEPSAETLALYKHLRTLNQRQDGRGQTTDNHLQIPEDAMYGGDGVLGTNLPLPVMPLVGRENELAQLTEKITRTDCRLITLVGQGGIGKTRLAIQTAHNHRRAFPQGIFFVDLAEIVSPDAIPHVLAEAMQFQFRGTALPAQQIVRHLRESKQPILLVLDNFEQIIGGARLLGDILKLAPQVTMLVTSRERLNLEGEWLFEVEGLRALTVVPTHPADDWAATEAMQLLVQCAVRVNIKPNSWTSTEKRAAIRITQLVEGMPLAIELASAWLRTLSSIEIVQEIEQGLQLLSSTRRDLPARHASIHAVFEHSWVLLMPAEQQAFARLSVMRASFSRQAAERVAGASLHILSALVDKSLVKRAAGGRFRLHELVRQYATEKLGNLQATAQTQAQHTMYYLERLVVEAARFDGSGGQAVLEELRPELENLRQAWHSASADKNTSLLASALDAVTAFYINTTFYQEGVEQLDFTAAQLESEHTQAGQVLSGRVLACMAWLETHLGRYDQAIPLAKRAIEIGQAANTPEGVAAGYLYWGYALRRQGSHARAREILQDAVTHAHAANLPRFEWQGRTFLGGTFWNESEYGSARENWNEALALCRAHHNLRDETLLLNNLGLVAQEEGKLAAARAYWTDALRLSKLVGKDRLWGAILVNLGLLDIDQSVFESAWARLDEGLHFNRAIQLLGHAYVAQLGLGQLATRLGDFTQARVELEQAVQGCSSIDASTDHSRALGLAALVYQNLGMYVQARESVERAVALAREIHDNFTLGKALLILGHLSIGDNDFAAAQRAYGEAGTVYTQLALDYLQIEARAGIARVQFLQNDLTAAGAEIEPVSLFLRERPLEGSDEPMRVYWTCYQIFRALHDPRAAQILETAYRLLQSWALTIHDSAPRRLFLDQAAWNREIVNAYRKERDA